MLDLTAVDRALGDLLRDQLDQVGLCFERQLASDLSSVNRLCLHVEQYRGKMLRPSLVLLCGMAAGEAAPGRRHQVVAAVVEMIHMATLVHDDILDEAEVRRRGATVNHLWGNEAAVMLGDYLISNAFHLCSTLDEPWINLALGEVTNTVCEGELMQLHHRDDYAIDEATYLEIVQRKTASLIGECCRLGARLAGAGEGRAATFHRFGLALGVAFQIRDDLLDLVGEQSVVGKSLGRDLEKGKLTLPLIHHAAAADHATRGEILRLLEQHDAETLRQRVLASGAVDSSEAVARRYATEATDALGEVADSPAKELLALCARTVVEREA